MGAGAGLKERRPRQPPAFPQRQLGVAVHLRGDKFVCGVINRVHHDAVPKKASATAVEESGRPDDRFGAIDFEHLST